jgi:hypothetical protein
MQIPRVDHPDKDYDSLVIVLALLRDAGLFGRFFTFRIFRRHHVSREMERREMERWVSDHGGTANY